MCGSVRTRTYACVCIFRYMYDINTHNFILWLIIIFVTTNPMNNLLSLNSGFNQSCYINVDRKHIIV